MPAYPTVDESAARLKRAGWSMGDCCTLSAAGPTWLVAGRNGENLIEARGTTQREAWHRACQQAQSVGMLGRWRRSRAVSDTDFYRLLDGPIGRIRSPNPGLHDCLFPVAC